MRYFARFSFFKHCAKVLILFRPFGLETNNIYDEILWQRPLRTNPLLGNHHIYSSAHTAVLGNRGRHVLLRCETDAEIPILSIMSRGHLVLKQVRR